MKKRAFALVLVLLLLFLTACTDMTGIQGEPGPAGEKGADGLNGETPYIKEGYWWIGDTNTNVKAEGEDGNNGSPDMWAAITVGEENDPLLNARLYYYYSE